MINTFQQLGFVIIHIFLATLINANVPVLRFRACSVAINNYQTTCLAYTVSIDQKKRVRPTAASKKLTFLSNHNILLSYTISVFAAEMGKRKKRGIPMAAIMPMSKASSHSLDRGENSRITLGANRIQLIRRTGSLWISYNYSSPSPKVYTARWKQDNFSLYFFYHRVY